MMTDKSNQNLHQQKFMRLLETNYKYSCFVTLTMRLIKIHQLNVDSRKLAKICQVKQQKNYGIVVLRLSLLINYMIKSHQKTAKEVIQQICHYLQQNFEKCLVNKYKSFLDGGDSFHMIKLKQKFEKDLRIFRTAFQTTIQNQDETTKVLTQLYRLKQGNSATKKQEKQANRLSKIMCGVYKYGLDFRMEAETIESSQFIQSVQQIQQTVKQQPHKLVPIILVWSYISV